MKLRYALSTVLLAILSVFRLGAREEVCNEASTVGTHANGIVRRNAEAAFTTRYLLAQKGTAADGVIINVADTRPLGPCLDEPASGDAAAVAILGVTPGTLKVRAAKAIDVGEKVFTAAAGKVTDTHSTGAFFIGIALSAAAADGDLIELAHCLPVLDASGTTL